MNEVNDILRKVYRPSIEYSLRNHPNKDELMKQWDEGTLDYDLAMLQADRYDWEKFWSIAPEPNKDGYVRFEIK